MTYNLVDNTFTISAGDYASQLLVIFFLLLMTVLLFLVALKTRNILDRYRLKYSFDKEIELKEMSNPKYLEKREKAFLKRVFKD